ncbi:Hypothetical predicted protein [Paramuricea clavata]|uniref:Uncharacterized protein n=1 Tax=Paramuricea clavata TaxID=317549 RepID=A0A6S7IP57_PARCT|nr:Hypothetical predicted protein [Paramuricea clavata]
MPHFWSNGNDSYVTSLKDNNPPESLPYLEKQQNSGTAIQASHFFEILHCEAEYYLAHGGKYLVQKSFETILEKRASKRTKSTKRKIPAKKSKPDPIHLTHFKDECMIVKEKDSNARSTNKEKKPNYPVQATKEDEDIIMKNRWLTDVQIGKAQHLLKQQFPNVQDHSWPTSTV